MGCGRGPCPRRQSRCRGSHSARAHTPWLAPGRPRAEDRLLRIDGFPSGAARRACGSRPGPARRPGSGCAAPRACCVARSHRRPEHYCCAGIATLCRGGPDAPPYAACRCRARGPRGPCGRGGERARHHPRSHRLGGVLRLPPRGRAASLRRRAEQPAARRTAGPARRRSRRVRQSPGHLVRPAFRHVQSRRTRTDQDRPVRPGAAGGGPCRGLCGDVRLSAGVRRCRTRAEHRSSTPGPADGGSAPHPHRGEPRRGHGAQERGPALGLRADALHHRLHESVRRGAGGGAHHDPRSDPGCPGPAARFPGGSPLPVTPAAVDLYSVSVNWALGDAGSALEAGRRLQPGQFGTAERKGRMHTELGRAWWQWGKPEQAATELLAAVRVSPGEVRDRPAIRRIVAELGSRHPRVTGVGQLVAVAGLRA